MSNLKPKPYDQISTDHHIGRTTLQIMEELLVESFPPEEYRELEHLREYTDRIGNFHNNIIFDDDLPIGFITYWDFDGFYYVEHFATNPALRNGATENAH